MIIYQASMEALYALLLFADTNELQDAEHFLPHSMAFWSPQGGHALVQGEVFHWTVSLGASIAESSNFFTTAGGMSLPGMCAEWRRHAQEAQSTHDRVAVAAQLEATLTSFGVLAPRTL